MYGDKKKTGKPRSFRAQLILLVLLVIIPAFVLVLFGNLQTQHAEKNRARERAVTLAKLAASTQRDYLRKTRQVLATLSQFPFLVLATNRAMCEWHFSNMKLLSPDFSDFGLIETNGTVFCHTYSNSSRRVTLPATSARVVRSEDFALGGLLFSAANQANQAREEEALQFGYPVRQTNGRMVRVIYASLKAPLLSAALKELPLPAGGVVNVLDAEGRLVARYPEPEKWVGKDCAKSELLRQMRQTGEGVFEATGGDGFEGAFEGLYACATVVEANRPLLFVSVGIPRRISFAAANKQAFANLAIMVLVASFVLFLAWRFSERRFLQPAGAMLEAAKRLGQGDLTARTGISHGQSELHLLARTFDEMAAGLEKREGEIRRYNAELESRVRERTKELETLNAELEAFSYSVSHDLRAPLRHMDGFAQLLLSDPKLSAEPQTARYLGIITKSARQMGMLIDDLLSFSRMARQSMMIEEVNSIELVEHLIKDLSIGEGERKITWQAGPLPNVRADGVMLRQVWINLIANALKYTRGRDPAIIEINARQENNETVFSIRDNGAGFDMAYADKLFGVFQRLHREDEFEGTGIGLANVRRIIHRHGGRTWAEGEVGKGAVFFFSLPQKGLA
jgi:signal transduction histidine kinase